MQAVQECSGVRCMLGKHCLLRERTGAGVVMIVMDKSAAVLA